VNNTLPQRNQNTRSMTARGRQYGTPRYRRLTSRRAYDAQDGRQRPDFGRARSGGTGISGRVQQARGCSEIKWLGLRSSGSRPKAILLSSLLTHLGGELLDPSLDVERQGATVYPAPRQCVGAAQAGGTLEAPPRRLPLSMASRTEVGATR
jgi:hypothetical protein